MQQHSYLICHSYGLFTQIFKLKIFLLVKYLSETKFGDLFYMLYLLLCFFFSRGCTPRVGLFMVRIRSEEECCPKLVNNIFCTAPVNDSL
jgi:hypothetical protein